MLSWRLKLREAEESFKRGRLDAAERLVHQHQLVKYRKGQRLAEQLANSLADRACKTAARGAVDDAWRDLARAKSLDASPDVVSQTENCLIEAGLAKALDLLQNDEVERAQSWLADFELLGINDRRLAQYRRAVDSLSNAASLAKSGRFVDAEDQIDAVSELLPGLTIVEERRNTIRDQALECRRFTRELQSALTAEDWEQALIVADRLLACAPRYKVARDARRRAVDELGKKAEASVPMTIGASFESDTTPGTANGITFTSSDRANDGFAEGQSSDRFILWVDGVGGFLTCLKNTLRIGQAVPDSDVDIPIQGDVSALHATIRRDGDEYLLEPNGRVQINGTRLNESSVLSDGDEIQLGDAVRLSFRRPHALSASARLDFSTRHRTHPWADAIILMAESCVLGPNKRNHIFCKDWRDDVVLFRQDDELCCRAMESLEIDGEMCDSSSPVKANSRVAGEDFSITFEAL